MLANSSPGPFPPSPDTPPHISCVLHANYPRGGQRLEVRVQDTAFQGRTEDEQEVFSWQCAKGEAIRLTLWSHGRRSREWLGCWNGEQALLHAGTLPVQVTFAGAFQPEVDPADLISWLAVSEHNGHAIEPDPPTEMFVLAQAPNVESTRAMGTATALRECEDSLLDTPPQRDDVSENPDAAPSEERAAEASNAEVVLPTETVTGPTREAPSGTQLAAWHADPTTPVSALEALHTRLAQMPAKTLLVDLRQHPRKAARTQETGPLSKQVLRQTFGARYWDRGWAIRTVQHLHPEQNRVRLSTVITNPHDPEGLPLLAERLLRGYSLLLFDRTATYEESVRASVIVALQQQVGNLSTGPLA